MGNKSVNLKEKIKNKEYISWYEEDDGKDRSTLF